MGSSMAMHRVSAFPNKGFVTPVGIVFKGRERASMYAPNCGFAVPRYPRTIASTNLSQVPTFGNISFIASTSVVRLGKPDCQPRASRGHVKPISLLAPDGRLILRTRFPVSFGRNFEGYLEKARRKCHKDCARE
ncbi:hypothetical protein NMY22_g8571 [Coprinellus aureogranulatus]|nr:hypothetical protein NMY22_g8571 [Coprinellus aureogranulatus]